MANYIFSPSKNAFYPFELKTSYEITDSWPEDGIDVEDSIFIEFTGIPPEGMMRGVSGDNMPLWIEQPEPTQDELIAAADVEKQDRIDRANVYMNGKQWPGKAAMGRLKDSEKIQYSLWLDYLDALEAVDTSSAPDINWPESPEV
ncbi:tail fiber assembly protein [Kluyvera sp. CHPC 1.2972]|uniref:tail fiber assembly protein n=1 Tax=Kluyvera sp. CHPC 1.2972 TaxID=2995176 RepID=UPI002FD8539F